MPVMRLMGNWVLVRPLRAIGVVKPAVAPSKSRTVMAPSVPRRNRSPGRVPTPGLGDRGAAGQGHEGDAAVVLVAADVVGVAADPEALGGGDQGEGADAAVPAGVPGQGQAVDRVEGGGALAGDRARSEER